MILNKKGEEDADFLQDQAIYIILAVLSTIIIVIFVYNQMNAASVWEDYYAKEITKVIDSSEPGTLVELNVQKAERIAKKNEIDCKKECFSFNNKDKEICVRLGRDRNACYYFLTDANITNVEIVTRVPENILKFEIIKDE